MFCRCPVIGHVQFYINVLGYVKGTPTPKKSTYSTTQLKLDTHFVIFHGVYSSHSSILSCCLLVALVVLHVNLTCK